EPLGKGAWSFRIYHKPFVRWIWLGAILMGLGGFMAALDKRYRRMRKIAVDVVHESKPRQSSSEQTAKV
ncbi:MAG TPA: hypothetical protein EYG71_04975, partial [Leucothrix sp.]|nr:hypothetical protein [Leucothrix sp.]